MAEQAEQDPSIKPLDSLAGSVVTFVGRDEHGQIYPRLDLMIPKKQLEYVPAIMNGMLYNLENTDPQGYSELLNKFAVMDAEIDKVPPPQFLDADDRVETTVAFRHFASNLLTENFVDPVTHLLIPEAAKLHEKVADYRNQPLVKIALRVREILSDDNLGELGNATVCAAVAVTDLIQTYHDRRNDKPAA